MVAAITPGDLVFRVSGKVHTILQCERLVLNVMQRMSGIATTTHEYVRLLEGTGTKILDTRKTTPGMRFLEKEAVRLGGGVNHRFGLYDMIMIKDNHIDFAGGIKQAISRTQDLPGRKKTGPGASWWRPAPWRILKRFFPWVESAGSLLDNFSVELTRKAVTSDRSPGGDGILGWHYQGDHPQLCGVRCGLYFGGSPDSPDQKPGSKP